MLTLQIRWVGPAYKRGGGINSMLVRTERYPPKDESFTVHMLCPVHLRLHSNGCESSIWTTWNCFVLKTSASELLRHVFTVVIERMSDEDHIQWSFVTELPALLLSSDFETTIDSFNLIDGRFCIKGVIRDSSNFNSPSGPRWIIIIIIWSYRLGSQLSSLLVSKRTSTPIWSRLC